MPLFREKQSAASGPSMSRHASPAEPGARVTPAPAVTPGRASAPGVHVYGQSMPTGRELAVLCEPTQEYRPGEPSAFGLESCFLYPASAPRGEGDPPAYVVEIRLRPHLYPDELARVQLCRRYDMAARAGVEGTGVSVRFDNRHFHRVWGGPVEDSHSADRSRSPRSRVPQSSANAVGAGSRAPPVPFFEALREHLEGYVVPSSWPLPSFPGADPDSASEIRGSDLDFIAWLIPSYVAWQRSLGRPIEMISSEQRGLF